MEDALFPGPDWSVILKQNELICFTHPSGLSYQSSLFLSRLDRLEGEEMSQYFLDQKDSFLISYTIDYFLTKSIRFQLDQNQAIFLTLNLFCAYRFRRAQGHEAFSNDETDHKDYRKFGEHWVYIRNNNKKLPVFVIGHAKGTLFAVTLSKTQFISQYELLELPRDFFYR